MVERSLGASWMPVFLGVVRRATCTGTSPAGGVVNLGNAEETRRRGESARNGGSKREESGQGHRPEREESGKGLIARASEEHIRALSQRASSTKGGKSTRSGPFNLVRPKPEFSNEFGRFFEAHPDEYRQLRDLGCFCHSRRNEAGHLGHPCISVNGVYIFMRNTTVRKGAVMMPHFNSRTTVLAFVVDGTARVEIACPHLSSRRGQQSEGARRWRESERGPRRWRDEDDDDDGEEGEWRSGEIENVQADVSPGDAVVIPAGHVFAVRAFQNLRLVGFGIHAKENQRSFVAGSKDNVLSQFEREEQDLAFSGRGEEVASLFKSQPDSHFASVESRRTREGRHKSLSSV